MGGTRMEVQMPHRCHRYPARVEREELAALDPDRPVINRIAEH
jgi:hypothetical protein